MDNLIQQAALRLSQAEFVVISTGAGVSRESGVPTFRDSMDGLWARYNPQQLATPEAFSNNPKLVWDFYAYRREVVEKTSPNAGHYAIAELASLLPKVTLITQNVDDLHQRAGSRDIVSLHGSLFAYKCSHNCQGNPTPIDLNRLEWQPETAPPPCPYCHHGLTRPDVVWFGETLPTDALNRAFSECESCDVMLVVGTSGAVYPAAGLPLRAAKKGAFVIEINPNRSEITGAVNVHLAGPSGKILPQLVTAIKQARL